jgi:hypothetical protein
MDMDEVMLAVGFQVCAILSLPRQLVAISIHGIRANSL